MIVALSLGWLWRAAEPASLLDSPANLTGGSSSSLSPAGPAGPASTRSYSPGQSSTRSRAGSSARDDIEMEPIAGHRRRKSSLMSPIGGLPASPIGRPRSQSLRTFQPSRHPSVAAGIGPSFNEEPKISEEASPIGFSRSPNEERFTDGYSDDDDDATLRDDEETGLSKKEKKRRQKRKRRNTQLDQRVVRDKPLSRDEQKEVDKSLVKRISINIALILLWYIFSLSLSLYNKWMFDKNKLNFSFPLFTTSMHMLVQFALAALVLYFIPGFRPQASRNSDLGRSRHESEPANAPLMTKMFYFTRVGPCGAATGLDIGLGNMSLKFISLTFYTMCKSSSLAFVLIFAFIFRLETPTWRLVTIITVMTIGVVLMVFGEVEFKLGGFALVISAAFFSGFRWSLTQILLLRHPATSNPFSSIFFISPIMFVILFGLAIPVEGFGPLWEGYGVLTAAYGAFLAPLFLLFPGCIAFLMTASEFALLQRTSVVTLSIAGIFKEVVTISAASLVFHDKLTPINAVGLVVTLIAIIAYNYIKISKMRQEAQEQSEPRYQQASSMPSSDTDSDADDDSYEETAGLLPPTIDRNSPMVTSDGDFQPSVIPQTGPEPKSQQAPLHHE
ncbi:unnamed protein product [Clonostachys rhizophaga]|uniref:Sugar phosphate transporter domain-containing protein n=1 Tax=Clonostachys rhizophaga TaxID=160324 RepID=A0A9N9VUI5_9HYPO|nr:unnamed protein product [Clonostachys rhizophaga]